MVDQEKMITEQTIRDLPSCRRGHESKPSTSSTGDAPLEYVGALPVLGLAPKGNQPRRLPLSNSQAEVVGSKLLWRGELAPGEKYSKFRQRWNNPKNDLTSTESNDRNATASEPLPWHTNRERDANIGRLSGRHHLGIGGRLHRNLHASEGSLVISFRSDRLNFSHARPPRH